MGKCFTEDKHKSSSLELFWSLAPLGAYAAGDGLKLTWWVCPCVSPRLTRAAETILQLTKYCSTVLDAARARLSVVG